MYALTVQLRGCDDLKKADDLVAAEDNFWSFIKGWIVFRVYLTFGASIFSLVETANFGDMLRLLVVTTCTVVHDNVYPVTNVFFHLNICDIIRIYSFNYFCSNLT